MKNKYIFCFAVFGWLLSFNIAYSQTTLFPKTKLSNIRNVENFQRLKSNSKTQGLTENSSNEDVFTAVDFSQLIVTRKLADFFKSQYDAKKKEITTVETELQSASDKDKILEISRKRMKLVDEIDKLSDSIVLYRSKSYAIRLTGQGGTHIPWFLPVGKAYEARVLAEFNLSKSKQAISALNNFALIGNQNNGSIYSEIVGGYFGIFRVGFSTLLATSKDTARNKEAIQRFIGGGGNSILELTYPAIFYKSRYFETQTLASLRVAADIPAFGTKTNSFAGNVNPALDIYLAFTTDEREFKFFADTRIGPVAGFKDFYSNLNLEKRAFVYAQTNIGVIISENISIALTVPIISTQKDLLYTPIRLSTQIIPNKLRD